MPAKVQKTPLLKEGEYTIADVSDWNFFDLSGENAHTFGTSNKQYHIEMHIGKNGKCQIFTMFGPTGGTQTKNWRYFDSEVAARKELASMKKKRVKKNYKEIKVAIRAYGTEEAKKITQAVEFNNSDIKPSSNLHKETQRLMRVLFGATEHFVVTTLRCPLGQLTNEQVDEGYKRLNEAKKLISNGSPNAKRIETLTNEFYAIIPHNLGAGARGKMMNLLLDTPQKIAQKEYDLETLLDAKSVGAALEKGSTVDDQYNELNTDFDFIDHNDPLFQWVNRIVLDTRAHNHNTLGKITVLNAWKYNRHGERNVFEKRMKEIAKECKKPFTPKVLRNAVENRLDIPDGQGGLYKKANVLPLFHGTRTQNIAGITKKGLLIRPSGVILEGSCYGSGVYYANNSSKTINYSSVRGAYYTHGKDDRGYIFIVDCVLGDTYVPTTAANYTKGNISPNHSVWAKGGYSGVINDEYVLLDINQHNIRYLVEFTCGKNGI